MMLKKQLLFIVISYVSHSFLFADDNKTYFSLNNLDNQTKKIELDGEWVLTSSGSFNPVDTTTGSPMIKVVSSDVVIDFANLGIEHKDTQNAGYIAVEVGYSPAELAADTTLKQPSNIVIKNLRISDFDCGLLVHRGVQNIIVENSSFEGCSIGVVLIGEMGSSINNSILNVTLRNITVLGHTVNKQSALVALKTRIETTYGYSANSFMSLRADSLNSDTIDVYTYYGVMLIDSENIILQNVSVHHIGYADYATMSEGNGFRTESVGILLRSCKRCEASNIIITDCNSELKSVGMQLDYIIRMRLNDGIFSYNSSGVKAVGIEVTNTDALEYSIDEVWFKNISCEENTAGEVAIGIDLTDSRGFAGYDLVAKANVADKEAYGIYTLKSHALTLDDSTFSSNLATRTTNDVATNYGIVAAGFWGENVAGLQIRRCSCVAMKALNSVFGVYLKDSISARIEDSQFSANVATMARSGEAAQIRSEQDVAEISRFGPVVDATNTGGYGFFALNTSKMKIDRCYAVTNVGHRSSGFCFKGCVNIGLNDSLVSAQTATGFMLDTSFLIDHVIDPTSSVIQAAHKPLLFSEMTKSSVNLVNSIDLFLEKMTAIRDRQSLGLDPLYDDVVSMLATSNVLQAVIARYRLWSTAFGIHAHNTIGCLFKNNTCVGQLSYFDNAVGICFTGRNSGHLVEDCNLSYNNAAYYSAQALAAGGAPVYAYQYNMAGMKVFWEALTNPWTLHRSLSNSYDVNAVAFSPDGTKLAIGDSNNEVKIWDTSDWSLSQTLTGHTGSIKSLSWSQDGTKLASGSASATNNIKVWNASTWVADQTLTHGSVGVNTVAFSPDGTKLASGSAETTNNIKIWNTSTWVADQTLTHGSLGVNALAFKSDNLQLASASSDTSNNIKIWNTSTWVADQTLNSHTAAVNAVAWNNDDSLLASGSADDSVKVWNTFTWLVDQTLTDHTADVNSVVFKENGKKLAAASSDNSINVWDTTAWGSAEKTISTHTDVVHALSWKSDGILLASCSADDSIKIWYTDTWTVAPDTDSIGIYTAAGGFIAQGQKAFGDGTSGDEITIRLKGANDRVMVSPVGPIGAGLILGDFMIDAYVKNNKMHFNVGNTGFGHGVLLNQSYYSVVQNNLIEGSLASIYGFGSGILDVSAHSANTYMSNILESNKTSSFGNANYIVPFNPSDTNSLSFPVTKMLNGNFTQPATDIDNIVIEYSQNSEFYGVESLVNLPLHPNLLTELTDNNCWQ